MTGISYETVYHEFDSKLRKFISNRISDRDLTEDILQNVYIKLHANINRLNDINHITAWLYKVTRNAIIDEHRRARPTFELTDDFASPPNESPDLTAELASSVHMMLDCLEEDDRRVLLLADIQKMKQKNLAQELGISYSGAKSRVQRARQKLRKAFLDCCHFEFDHMGRAMGFQSNCDDCGNEEQNDNCTNESC